MYCFKACLAAAALVLLSPFVYATDNTTTTTAATTLSKNKLIPVKEIISVRITPGTETLKLLEPRLARDLTRHQDKLYIEFHHRGAVRGRSLPLNKLLEASYVNLPVLATDDAMMEPIKCVIKRRRFFGPDKTLYTSDVIFRDGIKPISVIRNLRGTFIGAYLEMTLFETDWVEATVDGHKVHKPPRVDLFYKVLVTSLPMALDKFFVKCDGSDCMQHFQKPTDEANPDLEMISTIDGMLKYPTSDQFEKPLWEVTHLLPFLFRWLPFTKRNNPIYDRVTLRNEIRVNKLGSNVKEPCEGRWQRPLSDESMTRLFFFGLGHFKTRAVDATKGKITGGWNNKNKYVADMTIFTPLKYRDNFDNLGCKVYFDANQDITMIEDYDGSIIVPPKKDAANDLAIHKWERAKQKGRSALFTEVALIHLVHYHLIWGNKPATALRMYLPPSNPLRIAFTTHFFRTHQTCLQSEDFLVSERGPLGRAALPFVYGGGNGYKDALMKMADSFQFQTWPDEVAEKGMPGNLTVGATDAIDLHAILAAYVSNLVDEIYPNSADFYADDGIKKSYLYLVREMGVPAEFSIENFKVVWGEILLRVTGLHTSVGNAAIAAVEPMFVNFRQERNNIGKPLSGSREVISTVSTVTGLTMPNQYPSLDQNWTQLLHNETSLAYSQLKMDLEDLGKKIDKRNNVRAYRNVDFHPKVSAISIFS